MDRQARSAVRRRALTACRRGLRGAVRRGCSGASPSRRSTTPPSSQRASPTPLRRRGRARGPHQAGPDGDHFLGELRLVRYRPLFSGPSGRARPRARSSSGRRQSSSSRRRMRSGARSATETWSTSAPTAPRSSCGRGSTGSSSRASRASPTSTPATCTRWSRWSSGDRRAALAARVGMRTASRGGSPLIKAAIVINLVLVTFAYLTLAERKVMGRHAAPLRPEPGRPVRLCCSPSPTSSS